MKILHVVRQFHPCVGGIERFTLDLCRYTQSQGHAVEVLTLDRDFATNAPLPPTGVVDGIAIRRVPFFGPRRYRMAPAALGQIGDCDLIHVHCVDFFVDFLALTRLLHRRPLVVSTHGGFFHSPWGTGIKRLYFQTMTRLALNLTDRVVCDSPQDRALFARVAPRKCALIENGVDYDSFATVRKHLRPGLLVHVGRTDDNKRLDLLLRTFASVAGQRPEARLALVGPDWLGQWPSLRALTAELGVQDRVEFVGRVEEGELKRWLAEAHFFVSAFGTAGFLWNRHFRDLAPAEAAYAKMGVVAGWLGRGRRPHQTPNEFGEGLARTVPAVAPAIRLITGSFVRGRFGRRESTPDEPRRLSNAWRSLRLTLPRGLFVGRARRLGERLRGQ